MARKKAEFTVEQFQADVERQLQQAAPEGAQAAPFDGAGLRKLVKALDGMAEKFGPVIATLTPAQYRTYVELAAALIRGLSDSIQAPALPAPE